MPRFKAAHIREQGQNMIIFPLDRAFGSQSDSEQSRMLMDLEDRANAAGLAGRAVAVWESSGRTYFVAHVLGTVFSRVFPWLRSSGT